MPRALDRLGELALLLGRNGGDARRDDLAPLGDEALEQAYVLIIDDGSVLAGERAALAAAEKWACHMSDPSRLAVAVVAVTRSEEHTSELQSRMRSSYAVLCLKK